MAQWQELLKLDSALQGRVTHLYEGKFPLNVRQCLCVWIESQDWDSAAVDENRASACFHALLAYLDEERNRCVQNNNILQGPDFSGIKLHLLNHFQDEPVNLAVILSECLKEERKILDSASEAQGCGFPAMEQKWTDMDNNVEELKKRIMEVKKEIKSLGLLNENLDFVQKTWQSKVEQRVGLAKSQAFVEDECLKQVSFITQTTQMVLQQMMNILNLAKQIVETLTTVELPEWRHRQQMACIGSPADTSLDHLENWFTTVAEVLQQLLQELQKLQDQGKKYHSTDASNSSRLSEIEQFTLSLYRGLLCNALVVEKQPFMSSLPHRPLVIKTGVRFTVTVRFLANLPEFKCRLKVQPVVDKDVDEVKTVKGFRRFDFVGLNNSKVMDVDTPGGGLVAEFGHMSLKEKKEKSKGSTESRLIVTEELHVIKFVTEFQYTGLEWNIEASSLPVVVISSTNQVPSAWASVMWSMLSTSGLKNLSLFVNPPPLTWQQLSQALSWQFLSVGKRELNEDQLSMLKGKIVDNPDDLVQWQEFSKSDGFWPWIDGILDLIKRHMVDFWREGFIMGFVSREKAGLLLKDKQTGTFLLRFSESIKDGAITFSWVDHSNGEHYVHSIEPYTKKELSVMTLPDIINNYSVTIEGNTTRNPLVYLYPDIHKDVAFRPYNSESKYTNGYVRRKPGYKSDNPTPPPSPPQEMISMEMDMDTDTDARLKTAFAQIEHQQVIQELFPSLRLPGSPVFLNYEAEIESRERQENVVEEAANCLFSQESNQGITAQDIHVHVVHA